MTYTVTVWREPDGGWSASADDVDGAFTDGRSLAEVDRNIRESIAVALDLPRGAEERMDIDMDVQVGSDVDDLVRETQEARRAAERAAELTSTAVEALRRVGLSVRDVARILGITSGRVTQLDKVTDLAPKIAVKTRGKSRAVAKSTARSALSQSGKSPKSGQFPGSQAAKTDSYSGSRSSKP